MTRLVSLIRRFSPAAVLALVLGLALADARRPAAAARPAQGQRPGHLPGLRGLVPERRRQLHPAARLLQPQSEADARHPGRSEQPHRARRSRPGSADVLPAAPRLGRVRDQGAEGLRHREALHLDDRRQRQDRVDSGRPDQGLSDRAVQGRRGRQHAAEAQVRAHRQDVHRAAGGHRAPAHRRGRAAGDARGVHHRRPARGRGRRTRRRPRASRAWRSRGTSTAGPAT